MFSIVFCVILSDQRELKDLSAGITGCIPEVGRFFDSLRSLRMTSGAVVRSGTDESVPYIVFCRTLQIKKLCYDNKT